MEPSLAPIHGGPDGQAEPLYDFSTNANAFGPNPVLLARIRQADLSRYPDPLYTRLRERLAAHHQVAPEGVAVGAGASELIFRLVLHFKGPVLLLPPTFGEYARAALVHGVPLLLARDGEEFLELLPKAALAFLALPNNPTGEVYPWAFEAALRAERHGVLLVFDLAYYPLLESPFPLPKGLHLHAPNKAHGLTGVRAGYLLAPFDLTPFQQKAFSWPLSPYGVAFLEGTLAQEAQAWLERTKPLLHAQRRRLAEGLRGLGLEVWESPANFLLVRVGESSRVAQALRARGIRVRDAASFGLRGWLRLSAQKEEAQRALLQTLKEVIG